MTYQQRWVRAMALRQPYPSAETGAEGDAVAAPPIFVPVESGWGISQKTLAVAGGFVAGAALVAWMLHY